MIKAMNEGVETEITIKVSIARALFTKSALKARARNSSTR